MERSTIKNAGIGSLVGIALTFVPLLSLVAPLVGGGVAGYRERTGANGGLVSGALAGAFIAVGSFLLRTAVVAIRFGAEGLPPIQGVPLSTLLAGFLVGTALTLVSVAGTVAVSAVGGGLGGILEEDRGRRRAEDAAPDALSGARRLATTVASLLGGVATFVAVGLGVTAALDPYIWPSALVGLPVGAVAGVSVAVLTNHVLTTRREKREGRGGTPGAQ
jgi:hypothetical protein